MNRLAIRGLITCAGLSIALCRTSPAGAQQTPPQPEKARSATVRLEMVKTGRTGPLSKGSSAASDLAPGETGILWGWVSDRPVRDLGCPTGSAAGTLSGQPWEELGGKLGADIGVPWHAWMVHVQLIEARVDSVTLGVTFTHMIRGDDLSLRGTGEKRTLILDTQQEYVLGYVDGGGTNCGWANAMVRISAQANPIPNARAALGYDMWLVHEDGRGNRTSDGEQGFVPQGDLAHVLFRPRLWPIPAAYSRPIPGTACEVQSEVSVDFRGRIREDGLVDLSVEPQRTFKLVLPDRVAMPFMRASPGTGRKTLTVKTDEPIELVLPEPSERFSGAKCGSAQGTIDLRPLFAGQKTSLIIKVR